MTNCKNCGAILTNDRYCRYCGADTARTETIELKTVISHAPVKSVVAAVDIPEDAFCVLNEAEIKTMLLEKILRLIAKEDLDAMKIKEDYSCFDPLDRKRRFSTKINYTFL